jgi:hypothetical protein
MCVGCPGSESAFGSSQYIKINNSDFVAIQGSITMERLLMGDVRISYKQIIKSRVILKEGQVNYLLNHLGLGDNATFLAMKATYNVKSVHKEDNYILWNYYDDFSKVYPMAEMMVLTGSPDSRIKQLYLTNPSTKYPVVLDLMIAVIDDEYSYFNDTVNQSGTSFTGLSYTDIQTYVVGESIVINDINGDPLVYLNLSSINSISISGSIITIDDDTLGSILLVFLTENDANQANSIISYILSNPSVDISDIDPLLDTEDPTLYFYTYVGDNVSGATISSSITSSVPAYVGGTYSFGYTFSTSISLSTYGGTPSAISKSDIIYLLVDSIVDNRDGIISMTSSNIIITSTQSEITSITTVGTYSVTFDFSDIAKNYLDGVIIGLEITI